MAPVGLVASDSLALILLASFFTMVLTALLCFGSSKKKRRGTNEQNNVTILSYKPSAYQTTISTRRSNKSLSEGNYETVGSVSHISNGSSSDNKQFVEVSIGSSHSHRPHSLSQCSHGRTLPDLPLDNRQQQLSLHRSPSHSYDSTTPVNKDDKRHSYSPKGRRLPTPPPEDLSNQVGLHLHHHHLPSQLQDDEDMYAQVETTTNSSSLEDNNTIPNTNVVSSSGSVGRKQQRLQIKTLEYTEGSGDSAFYAKVGDDVEDDSSLYAQVDHSTGQTIAEPEDDSSLYAQVDHDESENTSSKDLATSDTTNNDEKPGPSTSTNAEYATIDRFKKSGSIYRNQPLVNGDDAYSPPPIPERNFDTEDELDNDEPSIIHHHHVNEGENELSESPSKGPTYDKVCVRESLEHMRQRKEVENERKQRYANLGPNAAGTNPVTVTSLQLQNNHQNNEAAGVYAQIDEMDDTQEGVYESLSMSGSADGTFLPNNNNHQLNNNGILRTPGVPHLNGVLPPRYPRQHPYEQIGDV